MASSSSFTSVLLTQFKALRESEKVTAAELESRLILGPGWVTSFESGDIVPTIDVLYALLQALGKDFNDLFRELPKLDEKPSEFLRQFRAEESGKDLLVHFPYGEHDATIRLRTRPYKTLN